MSGESNVTSGAPGSPSHHHKHRTHWHKFWKVARWVNPIGTAIEDKAIKDAKQRDAEDATYQAELQGGVSATNVESDTPYIDSPQARSGYKIESIIVDGKEWQQGVEQVDSAVFYEDNDWDGHVTYRKLLDRIYGPPGLDGKPQDPPPFLPANMPHAFFVHPDAAPGIAAVMSKPNFWKDVECELKGGKGCHGTEVREAVDTLLAHPGFLDCEFRGWCDDDDANENEVQVKNIFKDIQRALTKAGDKLDHAEDHAIGIDK